MSKYELTMSANYVPDWSIADAIREILQNAIDEETRDASNTMKVDYSADTNTLVISNKKSTLTIDTLLFGRTTKADNENMLGQHGEGYKVAMIVLLREGCSFTVRNYNMNEIWETRLVKSRRYNGQVVPIIETRKEHLIKPKSTGNLEFIIGGITKNTMDTVIDNTLQLQDLRTSDVLTDGNSDVIDGIDCQFGTLLITDEHKGKIFVGGLYVASHERLIYGYNFNTSLIKLDRDRKLVDDFNLFYNCSRILAAITPIQFAKRAMDHPEGQYLKWFANGSFNNIIAKDFFAKYGSDAVPVYTQDDFIKGQRLGVNVVMVNEATYSIVRASELYTDVDTSDADLCEHYLDMLYDFKDSIVDKLTQEEEDEFEKLLDGLKGAL